MQIHMIRSTTKGMYWKMTF